MVEVVVLVVVLVVVIGGGGGGAEEEFIRSKMSILISSPSDSTNKI